MTILITSVGTATAVNLIKHLKKRNHHIVGVDINEYGMTAGSLMVDDYTQVPYAVSKDYIDVITELIRDFGVDLIIPINDIEIYTIAACKKDIGCKCIIPDIETIEMLRDKYICSNEISKHTAFVPDIYEDDDTSVKRILRDRIGVGSKGISFFEKGETVGNYQKNDAFIQRCIEGVEYTVDVLSNMDGCPIYIVPRKRMEVKAGVATKVRIENIKNLIDMVQDIYKYYKIPGFSNIQFMLDETGVFWFIEINYRFSGCGGATLSVVPDYLDRFLEIANGNSFECKLNENVRWNCVVTRYYEEMVYEDSIS